MIRKHRKTLSKVFSLLVAVTLCFTIFTVPVSAEDGDGSAEKKHEKTMLTLLEDANTEEPEPAVVEPVFENGRWNKVHSNMGTFEKNFILSPEQKEYAITKYEGIIADILSPDMSDLEKYYTIAEWLNHYVTYDWNFWPGGYDFDYYSHQWDACGIIDERKSVCAGIAVAYANLCHAADLPCKFIRMKPYYLDHTINIIPNINGHSYYIDVTENLFFMSKKASPWDPMDLDFACITEGQVPNDGSFEYYDNNNYSPSGIKEYYGVSFDDWFTEYALHKNTKKTFKTKYVNKGSSTPGVHYASYKDYPRQFSATEKPELWFLEDFYKDPETISSKILNKEFDEQLLNISGIKGSYDCNTAEELATAVSGDIAIKYFPSSKNGEVVAKADALTGADYTVSCDGKDFDLSTGEATVTITGAGAYHGEYQLPVRINSAFITKAPVSRTDLVYTGTPQTLVEPGIAENGTILYAAYNKEGEDESWKKGDPDAAPYPEPANLNYTEEIPVATDAGIYAVWYKIKGDDTHFDMQPQRLKTVTVISPVEPKILAKNVKVKVGKKIKLKPALDVEGASEFVYMNLNPKIVTVSKDGTVKGIKAGTATITIAGALIDENPNFSNPADIQISVKVTKGTNPMKLKAKTVKIKRSKLRKKTQKIKRARLITVSKAKGKKTYKLVSAKKGKKSFKKYFKVNSKNGNVTVKKGLKKGTYKVRIKVKAAGNANYMPSSWKSVTCKVRVK